MSKRIERVLVANRGEIALRVIRACRELGIESVAVYSEADAQAPHKEAADIAVCIGPPPVTQSYLVPEKLLEAARETGADAIHPGYGFLSENAAFSEAVEGAGLLFIGPRAKTITAMGSKTEARDKMIAAGVPVVPGFQKEGASIADFEREAASIGYPVLVKAAFGGGGKGMRVVRDADQLRDGVESASREAQSAFGNGLVFLEKFVAGPRHVEVQVVGDGTGQVVHLGERECSVQRRHQKVIEECPCPGLDPEIRAAICAAGVRAAEAVHYRGAGTVEFLLDASGAFYFLEMNTRLQVEHPVTEAVFGVDLVKLQIRVAEGRGLGITQDDLIPRGHAIEARVYAECPERGFMPSTGTLLRWDIPSAPWVRVDSGVREGGEVSVHYDPMLAKVIVWGGSREEAMARLDTVLSNSVVHGVESNLGLLVRLVRCDAFQQGKVHTRWLDEEGAVLWEQHERPVLEGVAVWAAVETEPARTGGGGTQAVHSVAGPWESLGPWRGGVR